MNFLLLLLKCCCNEVEVKGNKNYSGNTLSIKWILQHVPLYGAERCGRHNNFCTVYRYHGIPEKASFISLNRPMETRTQVWRMKGNIGGFREVYAGSQIWVFSYRMKQRSTITEYCSCVFVRVADPGSCVFYVLLPYIIYVMQSGRFS